MQSLNTGGKRVCTKRNTCLYKKKQIIAYASQILGYSFNSYMGIITSLILPMRYGPETLGYGEIGSSGHRAIENLLTTQIGSSSHSAVPITDTGRCGRPG
jgi:hypothetical protein